MYVQIALPQFGKTVQSAGQRLGHNLGKSQLIRQAILEASHKLRFVGKLQ